MKERERKTERCKTLFKNSDTWSMIFADKINTITNQDYYKCGYMSWHVILYSLEWQNAQTSHVAYALGFKISNRNIKSTISHTTYQIFN